VAQESSGIIAKGGKCCIVRVMDWQRISVGIAGILGASALMVGAYAAHAKGLDAASAGVLERAAFYQLLHAVLLIVLATQYRPAWRVPIVLTVVGTLCFCGAIYLRHLAQVSLPFPMAPIGGISLMLAWASLSFAALRHRSM
jgi:uncharacterized membrane protein YgdD (TMEM256/DUF423 family)